MKKDCHLSFKLTKKYGVDVNSRELKYKRHHFAKKLIQEILKGTRIINYDESTIDHLNFTRRLWSTKGKTVTLNSLPVKPKLSLIAAVDSNGSKWFSLLQRNSDRISTQVMLKNLFKSLDDDDPQWRSNSIIVLDGASYHLVKEVKALFRLCGVRYIITSPHSP